MSMKLAGSALLMAGTVALASTALADIVKVPGAANPFYAGASDTGGDGALPPQSTLVLVPGASLTFSVKGCASYVSTGCYGPDGDGGSYNMTDLDSKTGIAGINHTPAAALVGIFLDDSAPIPPAPDRLDYSVLGMDLSKYKPKLKQMFIVGDGLTAEGKRQKFIVPKHATRLFLAVSDGSGWYDNTGSFKADVKQKLPN